MKKKKIIAKFKCLRCEHEYTANPGPTTCPNCYHKYVKWLNYEETFGKMNWEELKKRGGDEI